MIEFKIGRWWVNILDISGIFNWCWNRRGYEGLWHEYHFGFLLQLERESDLLHEFARHEELARCPCCYFQHIQFKPGYVEETTYNLQIRNKNVTHD